MLFVYQRKSGWCLYGERGRGVSANAVAFLEMFAKTVAGLLLPQMPRNHFLRLRRRHRKLQHVAVYAHKRKNQHTMHMPLMPNCHTPAIANFTPPHANALQIFKKKENRGGKKVGNLRWSWVIARSFIVRPPPPTIFALFLWTHVWTTAVGKPPFNVHWEQYQIYSAN